MANEIYKTYEEKYLKFAHFSWHFVLLNIMSDKYWPIL